MSEDGETGRIVVGIDGSSGSIAALRAAEALAKATGSWLDVVACWSVPTSLALSYGLGQVDFEDGARQLLQDTVRKTFGETLPDKISTSLVHGAPRQKLIELSDGANMLVVGRRGHGGFAGLLLGSVSQACVAHAHCPVLVVNSVSHDDDMADGQP